MLSLSRYRWPALIGASLLMAGPLPAATVRIMGGTMDMRGHVRATNIVVEAPASLSGTGIVHGASAVRGIIAPGVGSGVGVLTVVGDMLFENGVFSCHAAASEVADVLSVSGTVSGVATVMMTRAGTAYPDHLVIVEGNTASDYSGFRIPPGAGWRLGESGARDLWVSVAPGLQMLGTNGAAIASGAGASPDTGTRFAYAVSGSARTNVFGITNNGAVSLGISSHTTNGPDAAFFFVRGMPGTMDPGSVSNLAVVYQPAAVGSHAASLSIASDDPESPFVLNLAGSCYAVSPATGPLAGGNIVTITNGTFGTITNVLVDGAAAAIQDTGSDWVSITMPAFGAAGIKDVIVETGTDPIVLAGAYTVNPTGVIYGASPGSGSWTGGYPVVIGGLNLGNADITNVTLCGVSAAIEPGQSDTQVVVVAGIGTPALGDVRVFSTSFGETVSLDAFAYVRENQAQLIFTPASPQAYLSTNALSAGGGSGTGAVSYAVLSGPGVLVGASNLAVVSGVGTISVRAIKAQDDLYNEIAVTSTVDAARADQYIAFAAIPDQVTTSVYHLAASASSGLDVTFGVAAGPGVIADGTNLTFTTDGVVSVVASQGGDTNYNAAPNVTNTFSVAKAAQAPISFAPTSPQIYNTTNTLSASGGSGTGAVSFAVLAGAGQVIGSNGLWITAGTGSVTVVAEKAADAIYAATAATATVNAAKADQAIAFPAIADQLATNVLGLSASASSGLDVGFAVLVGPGVITGSSNLTFTTEGSVSIVASQGGDDNWNIAANVTNTFNVSKATAAVALNGLAQAYDGTPRVVTGSTVPVGVAVDVTYDGGVSAPTDVGSYVVTGVVNDLMYSGAATGTLVVGKGDQSIIFPQIPFQRLTNVVHLSATAGSGLPVVFSVDEGPAVLADGTNLSFTAGGEVRVRASQEGDANWNPAPDVVNAFRVGNAMLWTDYNGDGASDMAVFDWGAGDWYIRERAGAVLAWKRNWGYPGAWPMPGDYDGDGVADLAVFGEETGDWHIRTIAGLVLVWGMNWGSPGAVPVPGDYNGDGVCDLAVYDDATGDWHIRTIAGRVIAWKMNWGYLGAMAVPGDYDGDGVCDLAVYDDTTGDWHIRTIAGRVLAWKLNWGYPGATAVPGDYDGDGAGDLAVYDDTSARWYIRTLDGRVLGWAVPWGFSDGVAVPGDYDGDGVGDFAVYREVSGRWYVRSLDGRVLAWAVNWGAPALGPVGPAMPLY